MTDTRLEAFLSKQEIREVVMRYCRGIDRMDRELVRSCYHPDAIEVHGSFRGDIEGYIAWVWKLLGRYTSTMHFIGNVLIELAGELARCESYGIAFHSTESGEPKHNLVTGFRYIDRFERRDGAWRIARRVTATEWVRRDLPENHWPLPASDRLGSRDKSDPVYDPLR